MQRVTSESRTFRVYVLTLACESKRYVYLRLVTVRTNSTRARGPTTSGTAQLTPLSRVEFGKPLANLSNVPPMKNNFYIHTYTHTHEGWNNVTQACCVSCYVPVFTITAARTTIVSYRVSDTAGISTSDVCNLVATRERTSVCMYSSPRATLQRELFGRL